MIILGINGLGISPSASLLIDGNLIAIAEEERFNRIKGCRGVMPEKAVRYCLNQAEIKLKDVNHIAFSWNADLYKAYMPFFILKTYILRAPKFQGSSNILKIIEELLKYQPGRVKKLISAIFREEELKAGLPPVSFIPHHLSHAACSYFTSGYDSAYILTIDGSGEDKCTTVMKGDGTDIKEIRSFKIPDSLGWFYQSITEYLGYKPNRHEGKIMALAPYGTYSQIISSKFKKIVSSQGTGSYRYNAKYGYMGRRKNKEVCSQQLINLLGNPRYAGEPILNRHKSIAFHCQERLENIAANIVCSLTEKPDWNGKLCISGGVGLNCKMNGSLSETDNIKEIFIPPFPNDSGASLGAALYLCSQKGIDPRFKLEHSYWGPSYSRNLIKKVLKKYGLCFLEDNNIEKRVAREISQGKIVGRFRGRMEAGPRALGNRSILADPTKEWISDYVNNKIKKREPWRPFAPSLLYEKRCEYLKGRQDAPFMALSFRANENLAQKLPAVVHIDKTTRPHFVRKSINPGYWKIINEFSKISGEAAVLNTSFNAKEEPIVCSPEDAVKTFLRTGLDYLAIENFMVSKKKI